MLEMSVALPLNWLLITKTYSPSRVATELLPKLKTITKLMVARLPLVLTVPFAVSTKC